MNPTHNHLFPCIDLTSNYQHLFNCQILSASSQCFLAHTQLKEPPTVVIHHQPNQFLCILPLPERAMFAICFSSSLTWYQVHSASWLLFVIIIIFNGENRKPARPTVPKPLLTSSTCCHSMLRPTDFLSVPDLYFPPSLSLQVISCPLQP